MMSTDSARKRSVALPLSAWADGGHLPGELRRRIGPWSRMRPPVRIFLLSPANCTGRRATRLLAGGSGWRGGASFAAGGAPLGELFSFLSGLYFRGKLAYGWRFARPPRGQPGVYVMTATRGLMPPEVCVGPEELREFASATIHQDEPTFREPLDRTSEAVRSGLPARAEVILLGSVATEKYIGPLDRAFGDALRFPAGFVGMGDMTRGSVLLRAVREDQELPYRTVAEGPRSTAGAGRAAARSVTAVVLALTVAACAPNGGVDEAATTDDPGMAPASTLPTTASASTTAIPDSTFARLVRDLSEEGGYFDTDNLISNERSYLHVTGALEERGAHGGAYVGVGPDQNFSYMAVVRPEVAFMIDIRRDNLLQHLWLKALFELSPTRVEYLSLMFGRPPPPDPSEWLEASVEQLAAHVDAHPYDRSREARAWERVRDAAAGSGLPLTVDDLAVLGTIHHQFMQAGLDLRFTSHFRSPRAYYPTYRRLLLETDLDGRYMNYLADEEGYAFLRRLQLDNRVIPLVGDLAGPHALKAVGAEVAERGLTVSALYTSNVEFYLWRSRTFEAFAQNVRDLPRTEGSMIIRSYFDRFSTSHPEAISGFASVQLLQRIEDFATAAEGGGWTGYWDLVTRGSVPLR